MKDWTKAPHYTAWQRFIFWLEPVFAGLVGFTPEVLWLE
jgi:hypothetical protein